MPDTELLATLREACQGPFDFAWLLERAADFGQEAPTWHSESEHKTLWKQGNVPPPLQLLVPETILFHGDKPHCLFFTDCAGFLRASVRALKQPHVVYQCMEQILKQRKDAEYREDFPESHSSRRGSRSSDVSDLKAAMMRKPRHTLSVKHTPTLRKTYWRMWVGHHPPQQLPESDVAERLAGTRGLGWPAGTSLLQASFWNAPKFITYAYEAIQTEVKGAVHTRLEDIINNHFERYTFLDSVRDRNKISAVPNLLAQHLAYFCHLELLSGKFTFYKDRKSQLWLVDATDLLLISNVGPRGSKLGGGASDALPQKLFRYLSEEALQNLPVNEQDGPKHQRMFELMISYYRSMKQQFGVDRMLQKVQQELDTNVPVLEGTDVQALRKTFDLSSKSSSSSKSPLRHLQVPSKRPSASSHGCRWYTSDAAAQVRGASRGGRHGKHMAAIVARQRERQDSEDSNYAFVSVAPSEASHRGSKSRTLPAADRKAIKIEIVSTALATDLLEGAGTGACPEGATMDLLKPQICPPGEGLQQTRKNAVPCARAVTVPPGAAREAMTRLKEAMKAEEEAAMREFQEQLFSKTERDASAKENGSSMTPRGSGLATLERRASEGSNAGASRVRTPQELVDMPLKHHICLADCLRGRCWAYTSS